MAGEEKRDRPTDRQTDRPTKPFVGRPPGSGKHKCLRSCENSRSISAQQGNTTYSIATCCELLDLLFSLVWIPGKCLIPILGHKLKGLELYCAYTARGPVDTETLSYTIPFALAMCDYNLFTSEHVE